MKDVDVLIRAAQKIDPEAAKLPIQQIRAMVRDDLTPKAEEAEPEAAEPASEAEPATETTAE
ncbi:MAG: hypothetical protein IJW78_04880 [Clostridia bacterium]|nr:hypothetical protein [Clostridia bacterium]